MFKTRLTEKLGIKYPIIQGALGGGISNAELVAAVSNAGGLGTIAALGYPTPELFHEEVKKIKSLTDKPFCMNMALIATARKVDYMAYFNVAIKENIKIIETGGGRPDEYIPFFKENGIFWIHKMGSSRHAIGLEKRGVDAVSLVTFESGAFKMNEDVGGMVLLPAVVDSVKTPVILAGGVADGRGLVSALALGAEAVMMGTPFVMTKECPANQKMKELYLGMTEMDTMFIMRSIGNTQRVAKMDYTKKVLAAEQAGATKEEVLKMVTTDETRGAYMSGNFDKATLSVGQVVGLMHDIPSAGELVQRMVLQAEDVMKKLHDQTGS